MINWKLGDRLVMIISDTPYHGLVELVTFAPFGLNVGRTDIPLLIIRFDSGHSITARADDLRLIKMCS